MTVQIDPVILRKLDDFSRRRRQLIILRGVFAAGATLLLAMLIVAIIDALLIVPDTVRWSLSAAAYLAVLVVEWRASLRLLLRQPGRRDLARMVEAAEPGLRENLLSAVELAEADHEALGTSTQFRRLLERDVSRQLSDRDMEALLPVHLVRRSIIAGLVALLLCLVAFFLSGRQFGTLLLRALAPGANLARVSQVEVRLLEPTQPDKVVAQGEIEPILIEISGQRVNAARLETITSGGRSVTKMTPSGGDRFSAPIQVGREDVTYRVFAGDAVTRKFRLRAVARPHVTTFEKRFAFPAYVRRDAREVTEENGDLIALEGTTVALRLATNQPVRSGELRVEQAGKSLAIPLEVRDGQLHGQVSLHTSGTYRVHLVSAESGFENKFSPEYELRAEPDLVPTVDLELPRQDLMLPANEVVDLLGSAGDDQGLARVTQAVRVNEGPWREFLLADRPGLQAHVERRWDLYEQGVRPGDLLSTKLVAIDLKGSRAESRVLRIAVTKSGFETRRLTMLESQRRLFEALVALRAAGDALTRSSRETRDQFQRLAEGDEQRRQLALSAVSTFGEYETAAQKAREQLLATLREADGGHTPADLAQLGLALSRADTGYARAGRAALDFVVAEPLRPQGRDLVRDFAEGAEKAEGRFRRLEDWQRAFLGSAELEVITENLFVILAEARRLVTLAEEAKTPENWLSIAARLRVVLAECRSLEQTAEASAPHLPGDRMKWIRKEFGEARTRSEKALASGDPGPGLREHIQHLSRIAEAGAHGCLAQYADVAHRAANEHLEVRRETQPTWTHFEKLQEDLRRIAARKEWPDDLRGALAERRWEMRGTLLKEHGDLEEARPAADTQFLADIRLATLALDSLRMKTAALSPDEQRKAIDSFDKSFRLLEAGHSLAELLDGALQLGNAERWEIATARERLAGPREWRWLEARLRYAPEELQRIQPDEKLRPTIQQAAQILHTEMSQAAWQELGREMGERFNPRREISSVARQVGTVAAAVRAALDLLRQPMADARQQLAALAPRLHEVMNDLARKSEELQQKTADQAKQAGEKQPEQVQAEAQLALAEQQKLTERVEALKDALRADANQQDILKEEGRERARDADDALALLKEPPPKAEAALTEAAQAADARQKAEALNMASQEQKKLADALEQLAQHYEKAEQGKAEETRTALRKTEEQTGIKEAMERQFAKAEELQKMAEKSPEELLKQLEAALPKNPLMQQELSTIARNTLEDASKKLNAASVTENQVAQNVERLAREQPAPTAATSPNQPPNAPNQPTATNAGQQPAGAEAKAPQQPAAGPLPTPNEPVTTNPAPRPPAAPQAASMAEARPPAAPPQGNTPAGMAQAKAPKNPALAQAAQQQQPIAQAATEAGEDIARAGRHEQRLNNPKAGEQLEALGNRVKETAAADVPKAEQALTEAQSPTEASPAVAAANDALKKQLGELKQAMANAQPATTPSPNQTTPHPGPAAPSPTPADPSATAKASPAQQNAPNSPAANAPTSPPQDGAQTSGAPASTTPPAMAQKPGAPAAKPAADNAAEPAPLPQLPAAFGQTTPPSDAPALPATPVEQMWMARTLDALDAALNGSAPGESSEQTAQQQQQQAGKDGQQAQAGQQGQQGQNPPKQAQPGQQQPGQQMTSAQQAMNNAAKAAAASMRAARADKPEATQGDPTNDDGPEQRVSRDGAQTQAATKAYGKLQDARGRSGEWGKLPKQVAEQLARGKNENVAGEYRNQVETYYKVIAEKSKKQ